jgi:arsenate reductase
MEERMSLVIYHNPRCSKSRQALEILLGKGLKPQVINYLENPPSEAEIQQILEKLNLPPEELFRTKEDLYSELGLKNKSLSRNELVAILAKNPILIERPIVINGSRAVLGRPPENVLKIV